MSFPLITLFGTTYLTKITGNLFYIRTRFGHTVRLIQGMVSCPGGLFLMYVSPMLPLYAGSKPAPTRPNATPTETPKPKSTLEKLLPVFPPCLLENPPTIGQLHGADSKARRNVRKLLPLNPPCQSLSACNRTSGPVKRPSKAVTGASVRACP